MSRLLLLCVLALSAPPTFSQDCTASPTVATTDDQLTQYRLCTSITGNLQLGHQDCSAPCTITNLTPLGGVVAMDGSLTIQCCNNLTDLSVFGSLQMIRGSLVVYYNARLATISGFAALTEIVGSVSVSQNQRLSTISGFSSLNLIGGFLSVERNTVLADMNGFRRLGLIRGQSTLSGHALTVIHNTRLSSLTGLSGLTNISYGTVHIEGNTALCYAGYPLWQVGSYALRPPSSQQEADKGIDWRTRLSGLEPWQYTWGVEGGGYPTLFIRDNAPIESCASALCDATCPPNAGCLGPADPALCGSCDLLGTFDPCETPPPPSNTAVIVGVVVVLLGVVLLVLIGLGVWGCVVCGRRWKEGKKGSFDINLGGSDSTDFSEDSKPKRRGYSSNPASSDLIASYSTNTGGEPTVKTTYSSHAHPAPSSSNTKSHIAAPPSGPSPNGRGRGVAKSADLSTHTTKTPPRSPSRKGGVVSGRGANGLRNQSSSRENLLSSSRENVVEDFSPPSQGSEVTEGRGSEEEDVDDSPVISQRDPPTETGGKNRGSLLSREPSTEDILQKLLKEKAEIPMNFPRQQVKVTKEMGTGDFGKVLQADAKKLIPGQKKTTVVVKQLKGGASAEEKQAFLRPVEAMKILRHPNVLSLMGVVSEGPALQVMLEYCALGNFKTFLVTKRKDALTLKKNGTLLKMVIDMASGLCYLHSMSVAHNDFAVRSCLVTGEGTVKLGDYGITRQTFKEDYYARSPAQKAWPIRWMAPEQVIVEGKTLLDSHPVSMTANIW